MDGNHLGFLENRSSGECGTPAPELVIINRWQRHFPLVEHPFAVIADAMGSSEQAIIDVFAAAKAKGWIDRIGPVWAPRRIGWSTLAAAEVPPKRIREVGEWLSQFPCINHNYWRVGAALNLWFVLTTASEDEGRAFLDQLATRLELPVYPFPLVREYHIDLGFDLERGSAPRQTPAARVTFPTVAEIPQAQQRLVSALAQGIPLVAEPFAAVAAEVGQSVGEILAQLRFWLAAGVIRRFGAVVRHRALGWTANGMVVWAISAHEIDRVGEALAADPAVHLCYRRVPVLPQWPYTLYAMIYGKTPAELNETVVQVIRRHGLENYPHCFLTSIHCFKQTGARYYDSRSVA